MGHTSSESISCLLPEMAVVYPTYSTNQSLEQSIAVRKIFFLFAEFLSKSNGNVFFFFFFFFGVRVVIF